MSDAAASQFVDTRISRYFLRRLRREQTAAAFGSAVEKQVLTAEELQFDGRKIAGFHVGPAARGQSEAEIKRLLQRGGKRRRLREAEATFNDGELIFDGLTVSIGAEADKRTANAPSPLYDGTGFKEREQNDLREKLLRLICQLATPPRAQDVATLLVVAQALAESGMSLDELLAQFRLEQPIISIFCPI